MATPQGAAVRNIVGKVLLKTGFKSPSLAGINFYISSVAF
jgi:hypothetical protein